MHFFSVWSSEAIYFTSHTRWSSCTHNTKITFTFHRTVQLFHYILWFSVKRLTRELLVPWQKKRVLTSPFVFEIFWLPCIQSCNKQIDLHGPIFNWKSKRHLLYNFLFFFRHFILWSTDPKWKYNKFITSPENRYFFRGQVTSRS